MSEAEKPFEPTPQRIEKARREGDVARSSELGGNLAFALAGAAAVAAAPGLSAQARAGIAIAASGRPPWTAAEATFGYALLPVSAAVLAAIAAGAMQAGGIRVTAPALKLERLDPLAGLKRILSRETLAHAARAAGAFAIAAAAMTPAIESGASEMLRAGGLPAAAAAAWSASERAALAAVATGLLFAGAEYAVARSAWLRRLRMTFEERKREARDQDGDPAARGRRRALHRALLHGTLAEVKDASFVVANPTHVAVALQYRPPAVAVPRVTVRAAGEFARRVRALADRHGVPVVENVALARALYRDARVGDPIGHAHYVAVAEIVAALGRTCA